MDSAACKLLFEEIEAATGHLSECKLLVDLSESTCKIECAEIQGLVARLSLDRWPQKKRIALVSSAEISDYHRLYYLRTELAAHRLPVAVFRDSEIAVDWLAGIF
jgi:hypothetical protein